MDDNADSTGKVYANIRSILGYLIGKVVVDVTQQDEDEFQETKQSYVMLLFDSGDYVKFPVGDEPFEHSGGVLVDDDADGDEGDDADTHASDDES